MAKCLRCGMEISQPKCECGFDLTEGVWLLGELSEAYVLEARARKHALGKLVQVLRAVSERKDYDEAVEELAEALLRLGSKLDQFKEMQNEVVSEDQWGVLDREGTLRIRDRVTVIPEGAYCEREDIKSVIFPASVTGIGRSAFFKSGVKAIDFSDSVETIGVSAFGGCQISELRLPKGLRTLGALAFCDNWSLNEVEIPAGINVINAFTFQNNLALEKVKIPEGVTRLEQNCLSGCGSLKEVYLPGTLRAIEKWVFDVSFPEDRCRKALRIYYNGTKSQWQQVEKASDFSAWESLVICTVQEPADAVYRIPGRPNRIGYKAYLDNHELIRVVIPDGVTRIEGCAFEGCKNLEEIEIPDSVTYIGEAAFHGCSKLKRITLPKRLNGLEEYAFEGCDSLEEVILPGTLGFIKKCTFMSCGKLERITIPEGVTGIGTGAFYRCTALREVRLPSSLRELALGAFVACPDVYLYFGGSEKQWNAIKGKLLWNTMGDKRNRQEYKRLLERVVLTRR